MYHNYVLQYVHTNITGSRVTIVAHDRTEKKATYEYVCIIYVLYEYVGDYGDDATST